ncbi:MAG TPA: FAD-dependent oxidoreductase [Nitrososphaerales archaeon]|nr:FAD-dependent oxidoreductase [Nitrososphaerales archaeon]
MSSNYPDPKSALPAEGTRYDIVIIGAGILGVSLAFWLTELYDGLSVALVEKESLVAQHTSSRNTGVIHRPFYLDPERKKIFAKSAQKSYFLWSALASHFRTLPWKQVGTLEVALQDNDLTVLDRYEKWAIENGMWEGEEVQLLDSPSSVKELEPQVKCLGAIFSKTDTSVDYGAFSKCVFDLAMQNGVRHILGARLINIKESENLELLIESTASLQGNGERKRVRCGFLINAAGGNALDIAHMLGLAREYADLHFRGEYWVVEEPFASKVSRNIYSVAKYKEFPFLDPHFIIRASGRREIGPNAVLVSGPGAYRGLSENKSQLFGKMVEGPITPKVRLFLLNRKFLSLVWNEWKSSLSKKAMCKRVEQFIPSLDPRMLSQRGLAGVRTSVIDGHGFVPEAVLVEGPNSLHILNYNSPGATGAPAFSAYVVRKLEQNIGPVSRGRKERHSRKHDYIWNFDSVVEDF